MRVFVTGAAGLLGRHVVDALVMAGHEVHAVDRQPHSSPISPRVRWTQADIAVWRGLDKAVHETDAVVHLAAIPNLENHPEDVVFWVNSKLASRVAFSAVKSGTVKKYVYASSQTALGLALAPEFVAPDYLPVDEMHPSRPREGYGLSKRVGEELCAFVGQRLGIPSISVRLPVIWSADNFDQHVTKRNGDPVQAAKSLYAYIDARDAGEVFRLAVESTWSGSHMINVGADRPFCAKDVRDLARERYGEIDHHSAIATDTPLWSIGLAERIIGYRPRYRWSLSGIVDSRIDHISEVAG